jgi:nucleotide-binding universal stress UspA family protein
MFDESENTEIRVISAAEPAYVPAEPFAVSSEYLADLDAKNLKKANDTVAEAEAEIRKHLPDLAALTTAVVKGAPKQAIVEEAENWGADLIIMGSHGYGFWQRALLGSVSNSVVHHAPCSVLVVRPPQETNGRHD